MPARRTGRTTTGGAATIGSCEHARGAARMTTPTSNPATRATTDLDPADRATTITRASAVQAPPRGLGAAAGAVPAPPDATAAPSLTPAHADPAVHRAP